MLFQVAMIKEICNDEDSDIPMIIIFWYWREREVWSFQCFFHFLMICNFESLSISIRDSDARDHSESQ